MKLSAAVITLFAGALAQAYFIDEDYEQPIIGNKGDSGPMTITVTGEGSLSYTADVASLIFSASKWNASKDIARSQVIVAKEEIDAYLGGFSTSPSSPIDTWTASPYRVQFQDKKKLYGRYRWESMDDEDEDEHVDEWEVLSRYTVEITNVTVLDHMVETLTGIDGVKINYISWDLAEATKARARSEIKSKAIATVLESGKEYAEQFGYSTVTPVAFAELSTHDWNSEKMYGSYMDIETAPGKIEIETTVRCTFTVA